MEIGTWGTLCTLVLFFISAIVEFLTGLVWVSELGCLVGIGTMAAILVPPRFSKVRVWVRKVFATRRMDKNG
jgi:hypothetical protein